MSFGLRSSGSSEANGIGSSSLQRGPVLKVGKRKKSLHGNARLQAKKLKNQTTASECIKIIVRVRPITERELSAHDGNALDVSEGKSRVSVLDKQYTFDQVFDQRSSQEDIFEAVGKPIVDGCLNGAHGSIFAYGQTGSGKTYTMLGDESFESRGVIPRVLEYLFTQIASKQENNEVVSCSVACSFLEIYKENVSDLLLDLPTILPVETASSKRSLQIRQDNAKRVYVENLTETNVSSVSQAQQLLYEGGKRKKVSKTNMNDSSSRSHTVFTLVLTCALLVEGTLQKQTSRLNLVDLAGSESQRSAGTAGERLKEGSKINQSLSALGNVIMALTKVPSKSDAKRKAEGTPKKGTQGGHIPYRDSKLTWLLKDSLGGSARTCLIANVSPALSCVNETVSTLNFALRAKEVENKVVLNKGINEADLSAEVRNHIAEIHMKYQQEIAHLREQLAESQQRAEKQTVQCQCAFGADAFELVNSVHQMQMRVLESRKQCYLQKQSANQTVPLPSLSSAFSFTNVLPDFSHHPDTPASSASFTFPQTHSTATSPSSLIAAASVTTDSSCSSSFVASSPSIFIESQSQQSAKMSNESSQSSMGHDRVSTPLRLGSKQGEAPRSVFSSVHLSRFTESEEDDHKLNHTGENDDQKEHSETTVIHFSPSRKPESRLTERLTVGASPMLMHASYQFASGGTHAPVTQVSPQLFTSRTSLSPPTHFKFEPVSPSPTKYIHNNSSVSKAAALNDNINNNDGKDNHDHLFTVHSPVELAHVSPHRLRSADKLNDRCGSTSASSPPPHFKFHSTPSPNKYKTIVPTPPSTKSSPTSSGVFCASSTTTSSASSSSCNFVQEISIEAIIAPKATANVSPLRLPFSPLRSSEVRAMPQRRAEEIIHLHPVNHLVDYFEEENSKPQKPIVKELPPNVKQGQQIKTELQHRGKEKPYQALKTGKQYLRQAKLNISSLR